MRCFEIGYYVPDEYVFIELNNNMRCFEIQSDHTPVLYLVSLNNNMRCFEIVSESRRPTWNWVKQ